MLAFIRLYTCIVKLYVERLNVIHVALLPIPSYAELENY